MNMSINNGDYYKFNPFAKNWIATSGVMHLCDEHKAYWILDVIASYAPSRKLVGADYMLIINIKLNKTTSGCLFTISHEVNGEQKIIVRQRIPYTDLDRDVTIWAICDSESGKYNFHKTTTLMLPEEY